MLVQERVATIYEIAGKLGYPDVYTFSLQFKQIMGESPTNFRHRAQ